MKKLILVSALSLMVPVAYAQNPSAGMSDAAPASEASFSQIDTDRDGMISRQEASSFSAVEGAFDESDVNKDGALDAYEFVSAQQ